MQRTPVRGESEGKQSHSPVSANKSALLAYDGGIEEQLEEDQERKEEREDEALESLLPTIKEFVWKALLKGFSDTFEAFAHVMEENTGEGAGAILERMIKEDGASETKGAWMKEYLGFSLKAPSLRSKVMSVFSKICSGFQDMSLDLCVLLGHLEEANLSTSTFIDFDFNNLTALIKSADSASVRSSEKIIARKVLLISIIVAIGEGVLRAGAVHILTFISQVPGRSQPFPDSFVAHSSLAPSNELFENRVHEFVADLAVKMEVISERQQQDSMRFHECLDAIQMEARESRLQMASLIGSMSKMQAFHESSSSQAVSMVRSSVKKHAEVLKTSTKPFVPLGAKSGQSNRVNSTGVESSHERKALAINDGDALHLVTTTSKGNLVPEYVDFNHCYQRGPAPTSTASTNNSFAVAPNAMLDLAKSGMFIFMGLGLVMHSSNTKSSKDKIGRTVVTNSSQATSWVREASHIPSWDGNCPASKEFVALINVASNLPKSLGHLSRVLHEQLDFLKSGVLHSLGPFDDEGMLGLIESSIATLMANMSEASAKLLDGVQNPCMSVDGHWRGLVQLFWHQYSRSFSSFRHDCHSVFYPEALNFGFEDNRNTLFRDYTWTTQLTCELAHIMRYQCWKCSSDVMHQSCLSVECKKKRSDEETINVFVGKPGSSGARAATCRIYKG